MTQKLPVFLFAACLLLCASCHTPPQQTPLGVPARAGASEKADAVHPLVLKIESVPAGAVVVVDGVPSGKTPCKLSVTANARGFASKPLSVKVRFIAPDALHTSQTVEETLTPLDKVPAKLRFTAEGVTRVMR